MAIFLGGLSLTILHRESKQDREATSSVRKTLGKILKKDVLTGAY